MTFRRITLFAFVAAVSGMVSLLHSKTVTTSPIPEIRLLRTPNKGIQPQSAVDSQGVLHMIYFKGDASAGDIEYVRRAPGEREFSSPIRFNSRLHSALAVGTVRGPQMALGREGRIYGVWFGSQKESGGELARSGPSCLDGRDFMERGPSSRRATPVAFRSEGYPASLETAKGILRLFTNPRPQLLCAELGGETGTMCRTAFADVVRIESPAFFLMAKLRATFPDLHATY
jgi:hypothetical protein